MPLGQRIDASQRLPSPKVVPAALRLEMVVRSAALPSAAWIQSIDATYALFESAKYREQYGPLADKVRQAVQLCEEVVREFGIEQCPLSFNGGKDCTVLIHILAAVLRRLYKSPPVPTAFPQSSTSSHTLDDVLPPLPSLYITCTSPFQEVDDFVADSIQRYNLKITRLGGGMKQGLERYLDGEGQDMLGNGSGNADEQVQAGRKEKRAVKAMFIGTRRTDPHGATLKPRNHTDEGWPDVERVQPILDWSYQDVWSFLRCPIFAVEEQSVSTTSEGVRWGEPYGIPYCTLYDQGYTSLGSTFNTFPNPVLDTRKDEPVDEEDKKNQRWRPAYMLEDESLERAGRVSKPSS